jgi:hypothetical protein
MCRTDIPGRESGFALCYITLSTRGSIAEYLNSNEPLWAKGGCKVIQERLDAKRAHEGPRGSSRRTPGPEERV